ncbi:MAG: CoA transferase subunit A [Chloroflexota bacterium]|nr:CoA transferase subunit A [Chloroflexota bacterium]
MTDKTRSLAEAIDAIADGARLAIGGNTLHRGPGAAVHEIVRQGKARLEIVKTAGAYDVDLLCAAGCATAVAAGFVGFETPFGMAPNYRRAVEQGRVEAKEHACYTVIAGLRAAIQGVPFMPIAGMTGSDLLAARGFQTLADPYTQQAVVVIPALIPDVAIVHVHDADRQGNARIIGTRFEDVLMVQAARHVIVTTEQIVDGADFEASPESIAIAGFMVDTVVEAPHGAWPFSCAQRYDYDAAYLTDYLAAATDEATLQQFIAEHLLAAPAALIEA